MSWCYLCWGSRMTLTAMNNEAVWDLGDKITFFIFVQNRRSFRARELCSRCFTVYQKPSDTEVIRWVGNKEMYRDSTSNLFLLIMKEREGVERMLCGLQERQRTVVCLAKQSQNRTNKKCLHKTPE